MAFDTLRMQYWQVVDSANMARDLTSPGVKRQWRWKLVYNQLLDIKIENNRRRGHDYVDDAFVTQKVVLWLYVLISQAGNAVYQAERRNILSKRRTN